MKNYEIEFYVTSGNISVINDQKYRQKAGNFLIARPGDTRYSIDSFECYCIHFDCNDPTIANTIDSLPKILHCSDPEKFVQLFKTMIEVRSIHTTASDLILHGSLMELIGHLSLENETAYTGKYLRYLPDVSASCIFMQKNLDQHLTLRDIAHQVNLSPSFFHIVFKSIKKSTPTEYLLHQRMILAKKMLRLSNTPLSEIAILCGFGSQAYFCRTFKKQFGMTPKTYRSEKQIIL